MSDTPEPKQPPVTPPTPKPVVDDEPTIIKPGQTESPKIVAPAKTEEKAVGENKAPSGARDFWGFIGILAVAALLAFLLITFVFRSYAVDGPSMQTTLMNQDKLIIWKVPRTVAHLTGHDYIPKRGDIMIFSEDDLSACGQDGSRQLIKRVIGLPGDHVTVQNGHYMVYNASNPGGFDPDVIGKYDKDKHIPTTTGDIDVTLGDKQIFMSGDNRPDSCDSRNFGPIEANQIIGKLVLRLLPANKISIY